MNSVTENAEDGGDEISKVIAEVFKIQALDPKHFDVFDEVYRLVLKSIQDEQSIHPIINLEVMIEPEDPSMGTWKEWVVERSTELFNIYIRELNDYHSKGFARAYMLRMLESDDEPNRCAAKAYLALSKSNDISMDNPKYAEAFLWALRSEKGDIYAAHFSRGIAEEDLIHGISGFLDRAKKYSNAFESCLKKNRSAAYAHIYADKIVDESDGLNPHYADFYAEFYERLLEEGFSHADAIEYADMFVEQFDVGITTLEEDEGIELSDIIPDLTKKLNQKRNR